MGFKVEKQSDAGCTIQAVLEGDDSGDFLLCVQQALKNLWLDITVDMSLKPYALGAIMPHLLKLQRVIGNHHKIVVMKGIHGRVAPDFLRQLVEIGVEILHDGVPVPILRPPPTHPESVPASYLGNLDKVMIGVDPGLVVPLPPSFEIDKRFADLRERLAQALKRKKFLEGESRTYAERIKNISKGQEEGHVDQDQIQKLTTLEGLLNQLRNDRNLLQKDADTTMEDAVREEEVTKKLIVEYQADYKKRKENLDKSLAELNKKHEKLKSEFKKKSDGRKEKLARLSREKG